MGEFTNGTLPVKTPERSLVAETQAIPPGFCFASYSASSFGAERTGLSWRAVQIFSGVRGMSRWRMPCRDSASMTALTRAGVTPIVADSPRP